MGTDETRKTIYSTAYDVDPTKPRVAAMVLRAWTIYRMRRGGFADSLAMRRRAVEAEESDLRREIKAMNTKGGGTGNAAADARLREWAPCVL